MKTRIISIINQKGGIGKTTISLNLAKGLVNKNKKVLLIDTDPQGNCTSFFFPEYTEVKSEDEFVEMEIEGQSSKARTRNLANNIFSNVQSIKDINNVFLDDQDDIYECIKITQYDGLFIIPSIGQNMIHTADMIKKAKQDAINQGNNAGKYDKKLKNVLRKIKKDFDYIIIDNCPFFNDITINSLLACDEVIIPIKPTEKFSLQGLINTLNTIYDFKEAYGLDTVMRILVNMMPRGNRPSQLKYISKLKEIYPKGDDTSMLDTTIGLQDSPISKSTITADFIIDAKYNVSNDFKMLTDEIENLKGE